MKLTVLTIFFVTGLVRPVMAFEKHPAPVQWQRIELGSGTGKYDFAVYTNMPMNSNMNRIKHVIVIQHGLQRNGFDYLSTAMKLMATNGIAADKTLIIAPNFFTILDTGAEALQGIPIWKVMGWPSGEDSINTVVKISSFKVFDDLLSLVANKTRFPSLTSIVVVGYSDGGAMIQRYAALNRIHKKIQSGGVDLRYVIANSPSYLYFTHERPRGRSFIPYESAVCPTYNEYRYGMDKTPPYAGNYTGLEIFTRFAHRNVTYLLGSEDHDPNHRVLDQSCGAEAQGLNRLSRGLSYIRYERHLADNLIRLKRQAFEVIDVGHNIEEMFGSKCGIAEIFGASEIKNHAGAVCREISL